ncbi:MAG: hypothetical protein N3A58_01290 [Spirochaetes bacterium]|nr:hypothetical protein [Spirochaetota bacterium]
MDKRNQNFEDISKYFNENQIKIFKENIEKSDGAEVFFGIDENDNIQPIFFGNDDSVITDYDYIINFKTIIHNHPSGNLKPSYNDNHFANFAAKNGIGFGIINNEVTKIYFVVPQTSVKKIIEIDSQEIDDFLTEKNKNISKIIPSFKRRDSQILMAKTILKALHENLKCAIEANTGIGKSFAYLLPIFLNIKYNKIKFLITTNTISLQKQLIEKDIPSMIKITNIDIKYDFLLGRNNYICLFRFQLLKEKEINQSLYDDTNIYTDAIEKFIQTTSTGILDELDKDIIGNIKNEINSNSAICLKNSCKFFPNCFYYISRKKLATCDIIVLNNHLFFLNEKFKEFSEFIPRSSYVVFDEAHNIENCIEDILTICFDYQYFENKLKFLFNKNNKNENGLLILLKRKIENNHKIFKKFIDNYFVELTNLIENVKEEIYLLYKEFGSFLNSYNLEENNFSKINSKSNKNFYNDNLVVDILDFYKKININPEQSNNFNNILKNFFNLIKKLDEKLQSLIEEIFYNELRLDENEEINKDNLMNLESNSSQNENNIFSEKEKNIFLFIKKNIDFIKSYIEDVIKIIYLFLNFDENLYFEEDNVLWINLNKNNFQLYSLFLSEKEVIIEKIFQNYKSLIFTSATLSFNKDFDYFIKSLGYSDFEKELSIDNNDNKKFIYTLKSLDSNYLEINTFIFDSPFNYLEQSELMIVKDSPDPNSSEFIDFVSNCSLKLIELSSGRAFILTTSYNDLNYIYEFLINSGVEKKLNILAQNKKYSNYKLTELFKKTDRSVLIGTLSFWEGIDIPGEALELIIITRLPFQVPSSPVIRFKSKKIEKNGGNSFLEISLPYSSIKLKQGFGRLIRKDDDIGVCFIFDNRIKTKTYGNSILNTLPETKVYFDNFEKLYINYNRFLKRNNRI